MEFVWVIFESPEDTNLPCPLISCKTQEKAEKFIEKLKSDEENKGIRYWYEQLALV